ncbi:MAG: NINE protein [Ruminococcaceae bacterium]|nr:NINE protein [Oscillospiraceae bacterium]
MELVQHHCKNCGGSLEPFGEGRLKCPHCGSTYDVQSAEKNTKQMQELFDDAKRELINNLRRNLYNAVNAEYVSSEEVHSICASLKQYLPDDFQANFYDVATGANVRQITRAIHDIDVAAHYDDLDGIILYLIRSLQSEFLLELNNLIERAYKQRDLKKFELYSTYVAEEAEKVQLGVYETKLPREVFVAYSSKDMDKVSELVTALEEQGLKCFVAARNLRHGKGAVENYNRALEEAMDHCRSFVFVSSRNSRNINCDALEIEIPYVQGKDIENAPPEYRNNYTSIPAQYKKPRVEYRIEESRGFNAADSITNQFFDGYERVYSPDEVAKRIMQQLLSAGNPTHHAEEAPAQKKYCDACGHENIPSAKFCAECGNASFVASIAEFIKVSKKKQEAVQRDAAKKIEEAKKEAQRQEAAAKRAEERASKKASYSGGASVLDIESDKSPWVALLLCVFLGALGGHRFYAGKTRSAVAYIFTGGFLGIGVVIDLIRILTGGFKDADGFRLAFGSGGKKATGIGCLFGVIGGIAVIAIVLGVIGSFISGFVSSLAPDDYDGDGSYDFVTPTYNANEGIGADPFDKTNDANKEELSGKEPLPDVVPGVGYETDYDRYHLYMAGDGWQLSMLESERPYATEMYVPDYVDGIPVVGITEDAFKGCTKLTHVTVPDTVKEIGGGAFNGCSALRSIELPFVGINREAIDREGVFGVIFGNESFSGCTVVTYEHSDGWISSECCMPSTLSEVTVTSADVISDRAFQNCTMLKTVTLNDGIYSIGVGAFEGCASLQALDVPHTVTSIPTEMLKGCTSLRSVTFNELEVTSIGESAFRDCSNLASINSEGADVMFPAYGVADGVYGSVDFSSSEAISADGDGHFLLSDALTSIGKGAFAGCAKMKFLTVPFVGASRNATGTDGFFGYFFGTGEFAGSTQIVQLHDDEWNSSTFYLPGSLKVVNVTDTEVISNRAFQNCTQLTQINLPDDLLSVGIYAFENCSALTAISFPTISVISEGMLKGCSSLSKFEISWNVEIIEAYAFAGCSGLLSVGTDTEGEFIVPTSVRSIGEGAFNGCSKMTHLNVPFVGNSATAGNEEGRFGYIFGTESYSGGLYTQQYKEDDWNSTYYYLPPRLTSVTLTNTEQICVYAFQNCTELEEISIPSSVTTVGRGAFEGCSSLAFLDLGSVNVISEKIVKNCTALTELVISRAATQIGDEAFMGCSNLVSLNTVAGASTEGYFYVPTSVKSIGESAFNGCSEMTTLDVSFVGHSASSVSPEALFVYIFGDTSYAGGTRVQQGHTDGWNSSYGYVPNSLKTVCVTGGSSIVQNAFQNCTMLEYVYLKVSEASVHETAFDGCTAEIYYNWY